MEIIGVNSKSVVHRFFQQMVHEWYLEKKHGVYYPDDKLVSLPLFSSVRAGAPTEATDEFFENISLEQYLIDDPDNTVLISVKGDSMKEAGILEGDVVIVHTSQQARTGDMVIAIVDDEYTVKYLEKNKKGVYFLQPANDAYDAIYPWQEMKIFGVVVGSFRKY